jgi:hypothetical protein
MAQQQQQQQHKTLSLAHVKQPSLPASNGAPPIEQPKRCVNRLRVCVPAFYQGETA